MRSIHYQNKQYNLDLWAICCRRVGWDTNLKHTKDIKKVTCKSCLKKIKDTVNPNNNSEVKL